MAVFELWHAMNSFADTSRSETVIRNLGKILEKLVAKKFILKFNRKFHPFNCHLLKMNSFGGFSKILSKFYTIRYGLFEFPERLFQRISLDLLLLYGLGALVS